MNIFYTIALMMLLVLSFIMLSIDSITSGEFMIIDVLCVLGFIILNKK